MKYILFLLFLPSIVIAQSSAGVIASGMVGSMPIVYTTYNSNAGVDGGGSNSLYCTITESGTRVKNVGGSPGSTRTFASFTDADMVEMQVHVINKSNVSVGIGKSIMNCNDMVGDNSNSKGIYLSATGYIVPEFDGLSETWADGDWITIRFNGPAHQLIFLHNNAAITGGTVTIASGQTWYFAAGGPDAVGDIKGYFDPATFNYTIGSGYRGAY